MTHPKIVVFGTAGIPREQWSSLTSRHVEIAPLPESSPAEHLSHVAPFDLVLLNAAAETPEHLERIRVLKGICGETPLIMASCNPSASFLVQAYRYGISDCLLAPFNEDQLAAVVTAHLQGRSMTLKAGAEREVALPVAKALIKPTLEVRFLDALQVNHQNTSILLPGGQRLRSLLAYLLYHHETPIHRDRIIGCFWPNHGISCAKNNLNVGIWNIRQHLKRHLGTELIRYKNGYFFIDPEMQVKTDLQEFEERFGRGKLAETCGSTPDAAAHFRLALQIGSEFLEAFKEEEWTGNPREAFAEKYFYALDYIAEVQMKRQDFNGAIMTFKRILQKDSCSETVHRNIMECYLALGMKEKVIRQFRMCEHALMDTLGIRPSPETLELYYSVKPGQ